MRSFTPRRPIAAIALALSLATGVSLLPSPATTFVATAQAPNLVPVSYSFSPAPDAANYRSELRTFEAVAQLRAAYQVAAFNEEFAAFPNATEAQEQAVARAEQASHMAKARLAIAILRSEGNPDARAIDVAAVGVDAAATASAIAALEGPTLQARDDVWFFVDLEPEHSRKESRLDIFQSGLDALKALQAGAASFDFDPYAVVDWGTDPAQVAEAIAEANLGGATRGQIITSAPGAQADPAAVRAGAARNRAYLAGQFGAAGPARVATPTTTAPPATTSTAAPAPSTTPSAPAPRRGSGSFAEVLRRILESLGWNFPFTARR